MTAAVARRPTGPRNARGTHNGRHSSRSDKDGDLVMDAFASTKPRGGGISKSTRTKPSTTPTSDISHRKTRINPDRFKSEVARHVSSGAMVITKHGRSSQDLVDIKITGWTGSKASTNDDGGIRSLITWLEKRATMKSPTKRAIRVKKSHREEDDLIITVVSEDSGAILRLNGFVFAGKNIKIERCSKSGPDNEAKQSTIEMLAGLLQRRYILETKLLDLSALGQDEILQASQIFDSSSTTSKFFPALMKVLEQQFEKSHEKHMAIESVSLAGNELTNLSIVTTLAQTLPQLRNLDLSNNKFTQMADIEVWKRRFPKLDHLVIANNPIEQAEPELAKTLISWYPKLRMLNSIQVRTDEEAARGSQTVALPFPIKSPFFQDEGQIAETFIRTFFSGFDSDRSSLAQMYYDDRSTFSFAVNTSALRDPQDTDNTSSQSFDSFIKASRNLRKITHLPARQSRLHKGTQAIIDAWSIFPVTRHPDLATEAKKWLIECQLQPGLPDPTGQSPGGVDGFLITIHGEFEEMNVATGQSNCKRSFDRTFIVGPGGPNGIRVLNDMLTLRRYGGSQAYTPDAASVSSVAQPQQAATPVLPTGLTPEIAQQMVLELQKQTNMVALYAKDCLEQVTWNFDRALEVFSAVKATLPPSAFAVH